MVGPQTEQGRRLAATLAAALAAAGLAAAPAPVRAEPRVAHEIVLGLTGVHDAGYDRGLRYGAAYELSAGMLRAGLMLAAGDTDPRREQQYAFSLALAPAEWIRVEASAHHRTYTTSGFGDNLAAFVGRVRFRGLRLDMGFALRFPITTRSRIHSPVEYDPTLLDTVLLYRIGYLWGVGRGFSLGLEAANLSRFEIQSFDYPGFALVAGWTHPRVGTFRVEVGFATAGFFSQAATIDRGFVRLEYGLSIR